MTHAQARKNRRVAENQDIFRNDPGVSGRSRAQRRGLHWMREARTRLQSMTPSRIVVPRRVVPPGPNITLNLLQSQRTQVFGSLTLEEFRKGVPNEGGTVAKRMGGKEDAKYGPASAAFGKQEPTSHQVFRAEPSAPDQGG